MCTETFKNSKHVNTCQDNIEDLDMCTETLKNIKDVKTSQENIDERGSSQISHSSPEVIDGCGSSRHSEGVSPEIILESDNSNESSTHINGSGNISSPVKRSSSFTSSESPSHDLFKVDTISFSKLRASFDSIGPAQKGEQIDLSSESSANSEFDNGTPGRPSTSQVYDGILGLGMSPTSRPPVQVMIRSTEHDPYRIPDSVFATNKSNTPLEWSLPSNESLFSIQLGNTSFSRNQTVGEIDKSGESNKSFELDKVSPFSPVTLEHTDNSRKSDEIEDLQTTETADEVSKRVTEIQKDVKNSYPAICCNSSCCSSSCCNSSCCNSSCVSSHSHGSGHAFDFLINMRVGQCCYCSWSNCYCKQLSCQFFNCCWALCYCCRGYKRGNDHASPSSTEVERKSSVKADVQRQISDKDAPELNSSSTAKDAPELNSTSTANDAPELNSSSTAKSHWCHCFSWPWCTCGNWWHCFSWPWCTCGNWWHCFSWPWCTCGNWWHCFSWPCCTCGNCCRCHCL